MRDPSILKKFEQKDPSSPVIFTGDTCVVTILKKFENYQLLKVTEVVNTIGVFDMVVDGKETGMFLVGRITMEPTDVRNFKIDNTDYIQLTFYKGDVFMQSSRIVVDEKLAFYVWLEYIKYSNVLKAMTYEDQAAIFDRMRMSSGITFPVDHSVYEAIFAHLSRDKNDFTIPYRNTEMKEEFRRIKLSDVAHAARSTSSRIIGAYFKEGLNAALDNPSKTNSMIEDLLRQ